MDWTLFYKIWAGLFLFVIIAFYSKGKRHCNSRDENDYNPGSGGF